MMVSYSFVDLVLAVYLYLTLLSYLFFSLYKQIHSEVLETRAKYLVLYLVTYMVDSTFWLAYVKGKINQYN